MTIALLFLLFSLTSSLSVHTMDLSESFNLAPVDIDHLECTALAFAYVANTITVKDIDQKLIGYTYNEDGPFVTTLAQAHHMFDAMLTNQDTALPESIKKQILELKKNNKKLNQDDLQDIAYKLEHASEKELYNLTSGYLQWQLMLDETHYMRFLLQAKKRYTIAEENLINKMNFKTALLDQNITLLKSLMNAPINPDQQEIIDGSFNAYLHNVIEKAFNDAKVTSTRCSIS